MKCNSFVNKKKLNVNIRTLEVEPYTCKLLFEFSFKRNNFSWQRNVLWKSEFNIYLFRKKLNSSFMFKVAIYYVNI